MSSIGGTEVCVIGTLPYYPVCLVPVGVGAGYLGRARSSEPVGAQPRSSVVPVNVSDLGYTLQITMVKGCNWPLGTSRVDESAGLEHPQFTPWHGLPTSPLHALRSLPPTHTSAPQLPPANCSKLDHFPQPVL